MSRQTPTAAARRVLLAGAFIAILADPLGARTPPQPELPTITLTIRDLRLEAEVADDPDEKRIGLMGRKDLAEGRGMLFVFPRPQPMGFWMKDTFIPLSIAYINADGIIREIHDMEPLDENSTPSVFQDLLYALEVPQGWFAKKGILAGDRVIGLPKPRTQSD